MAFAKTGKLTVSYTVICAHCVGETHITYAINMADAAKMLREGDADMDSGKWVTSDGQWYHRDCLLDAREEAREDRRAAEREAAAAETA